MKKSYIPRIYNIGSKLAKLGVTGATWGLNIISHLNNQVNILKKEKLNIINEKENNFSYYLLKNENEK